MKLTTESIRVNDIELANEIIWVMNGTAIKQADEVEQLRAELAHITAGSEAMQRDAVNNTATINMLMAQLAKLKAPIEDVKIYCNNPSTWEHYDDGVSEKIRTILKAAGIA